MIEEKADKKMGGKEPKVAIVHDFLREYGGAERVVEALHQIYPEAPVMTAFVDWRKMGKSGERFRRGWQIQESYLAKWPFFKKLYSPLRFLAPRAMAKSFDLDEYDVVISSTNAYFARAAHSHKKDALHIDYCHTPTRSLYGYTTQSTKNRNPFFKWGSDLINHSLRLRDFEVAQEVDIFVANSKEVKKRIEKFYRREAVVINPPVKMVDMAMKLVSEEKKTASVRSDKKANLEEKKKKHNEEISSENEVIQKKPFYLYFNRLNYAKHPELALEVALELGVDLKIAGTGPMLEELKEQLAESEKLKKPDQKIEFLGAVSDEKLIELFETAEALIYPVVDEDFGMIPVEAMAFGLPVLAHRSGGPTETVIEGETGLFFDEIKTESLKKAWQKMMTMNFNRQKIKEHAEQYSLANFEQRIKKLVDQNWPYKKN